MMNRKLYRRSLIASLALVAIGVVGFLAATRRPHPLEGSWAVTTTYQDGAISMPPEIANREQITYKFERHVVRKSHKRAGFDHVGAWKTDERSRPPILYVTMRENDAPDAGAFELVGRYGVKGDHLTLILTVTGEAPDSFDSKQWPSARLLYLHRIDTQ